MDIFITLHFSNESVRVVAERAVIVAAHVLNFTCEERLLGVQQNIMFVCLRINYQRVRNPVLSIFFFFFFFWKQKDYLERHLKSENLDKS